MRRKVRPSLPAPLPRPLVPAPVPALTGSRLPTAAALALALAGLGCSAPTPEGIAADPVRGARIANTAPTTAPTSATGGGPVAPPIEPDPIAVDGEAAMVTPVPVAPPPPPTPKVTPTPSFHPPKTAGKPMAVHPSI